MRRVGRMDVLGVVWIGVTQLPIPIDPAQQFPVLNLLERTCPTFYLESLSWLITF